MKVKPNQIWIWKGLNPNNPLGRAKIRILKVSEDKYPGLVCETIEAENTNLFQVGEHKKLYYSHNKHEYGSIENFLTFFNYTFLNDSPTIQNKYGYNCIGCNLFYSCVEPNQSDSTYKCYECRNRLS